MIYAIYETESGRLVTFTADATKVASQSILDARGYTLKEFADGSADNATWNASTLSFDALPASKDPMTPKDFLARFTADEFAAITSSTDNNVKFLYAQLMVAQYVDRMDSATIGGVQYLEQIGVIASGRSAEILA